MVETNSIFRFDDLKVEFLAEGVRNGVLIVIEERNTTLTKLFHTVPTDTVPKFEIQSGRLHGRFHFNGDKITSTTAETD